MMDKKIITLEPSYHDCTEKFQKVLVDIHEETELRLDPGEYHFWPENAARRDFAISNTDTIRYPTQIIGLLLEGKRGLHLIGENAKLVFHGCQMAIGIRDCTDIRFSGITVDYACPSAVDITVLESDGREVLAAYPTPHRFGLENGNPTWYGEEGSNGPYWKMPGDMELTQLLRDGMVERIYEGLFLDSKEIIPLPGERIRLRYTHERDVRAGDVYQVRRILRDSCGIFVGNSRGITFEGVQIAYLYAMGIVHQCSTDLTFRQTAFQAIEEGRHSASGADFLQFSGCGGKILVENCLFVNPHDDPINIHGTFLEVKNLGGNRIRLQYCHSQTLGFASVFPGDILEFFEQETLLSTGERYRVLSVEGPTLEVPEHIEVLLDRAPIAEEGLVAENISWCPEVEIRGNTFVQIPARGILLTTRGKSIIENNDFQRMKMAAIFISCDAQDWYESGPVRNVTIRGNRFADCRVQALLVEPTNRAVKPGAFVHENIRFLGNHLTRMPMPAVSLQSVSGAVVEGNLCTDCLEGDFLVLDHVERKAAEVYSFAPQCPAQPSPLSGFGSETHQINSRYLTKNSNPWLPISGELHYSRLPRHTWGMELDKMKAAGLDLVSTYVIWLHHEEIEGEFRFDDNLDLGHFVDLCHERGLGVVLRAGPWVHGECRNGGHPDWILEKCGGRVRCNEEPYLTYVRAYFQKLAAHLGERELFSIQVENELVNNCDHLKWLCKTAKESGLKAPFYTVTGWGYETKELTGTLLPTFGGYPEQPWNQNTLPSSPNPHFFFTGIRCDGMIGNDLLPLQQAQLDESVPHLTCEIGPGVQCCEHRRPRITPEDALSMAVTTIGDGCNWLGYYMFHGGSNPMGKLTSFQESTDTGYPNNCPVISYDFQAPIGECGQLRESYFRLQSFHHFLNAYGDLLAPMTSTFPDRRPVGLLDTETLRCCIRSDGHTAFLFVNNHHHGKRLPEHPSVFLRVALAEGETCFTLPTVPTDATFVFPIQLPLSDSLTLTYAFAQPIGKAGKDYWFESVPGIPPLFQFSTGESVLITDTYAVGDISFHVVPPPAMPTLPEGHTLTPERLSTDEWRLTGLPLEGCIVSIDYHGNKAEAYADGRLIGDQYYYGEPWMFRVPKGCTDVLVKISPLLPEHDIYLECERQNGVALENAKYMFEENLRYGEWNAAAL